MRTSLLTILGSLSTLVALASPPGYHAPRRFYTAKHEAYSRPSVRLVLGGNTTYYNGDLTSSPGDNTFKLGGSIGILDPLSPHVSYGLDAAYLQMQAVDHNVNRGLRFSGDYEQLTTYVRYNLNADRSMMVGQNYHATPVLLFLQAGVGGVVYNPSAQYRVDGTNYAAVPEAAGGYPAVAAVAPVGGGVTFKAGSHLAFTLEALYHFTTTDLIDGVSAASSHFDNYATGAFKVEFGFGGGGHHGKPLTHND